MAHFATILHALNAKPPLCNSLRSSQLGGGERKDGGSGDDAPRPTYRFLAASPSNMRISDVSQLLVEYKGLVKMVEGLLNDRRVMEKEKRRLEMERERTLLEKRREQEESGE